MSNPEQPSPAPDQQPAPAAQPAAPAPQGNQSRPPQPGARRPGGADRPFSGGSKKPFPRSDRPKNPGGMPDNLDKRDFGAFKPNNRELDKAIEDELAAALGGFSAE